MNPRDRLQPDPKSPLSQGWQRLFGEARTRILLWYLLLMGFFIIVAIPLMQQFVFAQVDARVREDLREDMELFQRLLENDPDAKEALGLLEDAPPQKLVIPPSNQQEFQILADVYLSRRIPEDDTFLIAFVDGTLYRSSPKALPHMLHPALG